MSYGIPGKHSIKPGDPNSERKKIKYSGSCLYLDASYVSLYTCIYLNKCVDIIYNLERRQSMYCKELKKNRVQGK